jgi:ribosome-associated protein
LNKEKLIKELDFTAVRSGGAGGQHVNKVSSKIVLRFNVKNSATLTEEEKELLYKNLSNKLNKELILIVTCSESRSQHKNKELAIIKFIEIITAGLKIKKVRKATKPSKKARRKRLEKKAKHALKKVNRQKLRY